MIGTRRVYHVLTALALGIFALSATPAQAGAIVSAVGATINAGGPGFGSINDTFNQNGLSSNYVSGVTDFDAYIGTNPTHTQVFAGFEWFSNAGTTGATVTYDLGSILSIDRLALWNEEASGIGTLDLLGSTDGVGFSPIASDLHPFDNLSGPDYPAEVFSFATTSARFIRFVITDSPQPNPGTFPAAAIGEVAFRQGVSSPPPTTVIPEPSSMVLIGMGVVGLAGYGWRRRKQQSGKLSKILGFSVDNG